MMSKNRISIVVAVVVLAIIGFVVWQKMDKDNYYSVVYLTTGEVYIGKLTTFPDMQLRNGYILQIAKDATDPTKSTFQLQPLSEALWAPESLHLNPKNVVFSGPLLATSKIAQTLAAQKK